MAGAHSVSPERGKKDKKEKKEKKEKKSKEEKRDRDYDREHERDRGERERAERAYREKERERERERYEREQRERERYEKEARERRERERYEREARERERTRDRERERERDHDRDRDRGRSKRDRRSQSPEADGAGKRRREEEGSGLNKEEEYKKRKEEEQAALDAEMEKRRKRVEDWRLKKMTEAATAAVAGALMKEEEEGNAKVWTLEDDEDDEDEGGEGGEGDADGVADGEPGAEGAKVAEGDAAKAASAEGTPKKAAKMPVKESPGAAMEEEEEDPLDAFMADQVVPEVEAMARREYERTLARRSETPGPPELQARPSPGVVKMEVDVAGAEVKVENGIKKEMKEEENGTGVVGPVSMKVEGGAGAKPTIVVRYFGRLFRGLGVRRGGAAVRGRRPRGAVSAYSDSESSSSADDEAESEEDMDDAEWARLVTSGKLSKGDKLGPVDHSQISYIPFRKAFYIGVPELSKMNEAAVAEMRKEMDGIKVRGTNIPAPLRTWTQAGLHSKVLDTLFKAGFTRPLPIQSQALPVIMSGRDCIGIAKTGSGKTLAFVLPMLRHVKDQPPLEQGDGPISLIMAPTRELVQQIAKEIKLFTKPMNIMCVAVFGGSGVANQITELKRGCEIVVCTPGRMIDLLVTSNGKITNLRRVTYLVLDEADRMFDMGFEPQINRIVQNIQPDRQTVMFSATFPRQVEALARNILDNPIEIQVGGRSVVNADITQVVEIRPEAERFFRLLEILGEWQDKGKVIIFVDRQESCDELFKDLIKYGHSCLSLHGGKDQSDRESTIADFKGAVCNVLVSTGVAARGLDVKELVLVVNYDVPNHMEEYVHRVGRTGRAGNKGTAITFIGPDEEKYAPDIVKALKDSGAPVPQDVQALANSFSEKRKAGLVQGHGSGYGGSGFKFDTTEEDKYRQARKAKAREFAGSDADSSSDDDIRPAGTNAANEKLLAVAAAAAASNAPAAPAAIPAAAGNPTVADALAAAQAQANSFAAAFAASNPGAAGAVLPVPAPTVGIAAAHAVAARLAASVGTTVSLPTATAPPVTAPVPAMPAASPLSAMAAAAAAAVAAATPAAMVAVQAAALAQAALMASNPLLAAAAAAPNPALGAAGIPGLGGAAAGVSGVARAAALAAAWSGGGTVALPGDNKHVEMELEINDFPQHARWKVTHKDSMALINELTGAAVTTRGVYVPLGKQPPVGERKLYLLIEGPTEQSVKRAKQEIKRILEETTEKVMRRDAPAAGKYSIM